MRKIHSLRWVNTGFVLSLVCSVAGGCASTKSAPTPKVYDTPGEEPYVEVSVQPPEGYQPALAKQLTFVGENGEGYFDASGNRIIFQSKNRPAHSTTQIYVLDLKTKTEKRVTTDAGEHTCAYFDPRNSNQVIYSSTQDELREHPELLEGKGAFEIKYAAKNRKYEWKFLPYEIYKHNLKTEEVTRLTHSVGYDAEATFNAIGSKIIFTSVREADLELYQMDRDGLNQRRMTEWEGYDGGAFFSPDNTQVVWRGFHLPDGTCHLYTSDVNGQNQKQLTVDKGIHWCPSWHPRGQWIIYSSNRAGIGNFELYITDPEGKCHRRLTYSPRSDILPVFSPDGKRILFTSDRKGPRVFTSAEGATLLMFKGEAGKIVFYPPAAKRKLEAKVLPLPPGLKPEKDTLTIVYKLLGQEIRVSISQKGEKKYAHAKGEVIPTEIDKKYGNTFIRLGDQKVWTQVNYSDDGNFYRLDPTQKLFSTLDPEGGEFFMPNGEKVRIHTDRQDETRWVDPKGKKLLALAKRAMRSQLYLMDFVVPQTACLELTKAP